MFNMTCGKICSMQVNLGLKGKALVETSKLIDISPIIIAMATKT